ncbi:hypothetical protein [Cardinium endosymbiont of Oedothorax gibbosus]|uniref:hypothetical protein n=1 Tax=Cardinium endosymbiont of Oedothorax gibbosus TaxID=931101 RepID=UPI0020240CF3|nr:hypothetical protein [Cardinium endosymbiont of Oedothorax gibbosus]
MGYEKVFLASMPYITLPTIIVVLLHFCYHHRFYSTIMLEEIYQYYVHTTQAKGLQEEIVLFKHNVSSGLDYFFI